MDTSHQLHSSSLTTYSEGVVPNNDSKLHLALFFLFQGDQKIKYKITLQAGGCCFHSHIYSTCTVVNVKTTGLLFLHDGAGERQHWEITQILQKQRANYPGQRQPRADLQQTKEAEIHGIRTQLLEKTEIIFSLYCPCPVLLNCPGDHVNSNPWKDFCTVQLSYWARTILSPGLRLLCLRGLTPRLRNSDSSITNIYQTIARAQWQLHPAVLLRATVKEWSSSLPSGICEVFSFY